MSSEITLEQIKALKANSLHHVDLDDPCCLIANFYGVGGIQASTLYATAKNTQEHLLKGSEAIHQLLYEVVVFQNDFAPDAVENILLMLPYVSSLTKGIDLAMEQLSGEMSI